MPSKVQKLNFLNTLKEGEREIFLSTKKFKYVMTSLPAVPSQNFFTCIFCQLEKAVGCKYLHTKISSSTALSVNMRLLICNLYYTCNLNSTKDYAKLANILTEKDNEA